MVRPSANNSQILVWRPKVGEPVIVVPPKETYKESNPITIFKGGSTMSRKPHMIRQIGKEVSPFEAVSIKLHVSVDSLQLSKTDRQEKK